MPKDNDRKAKKLLLKKEMIRELTTNELEQVYAGAPNSVGSAGDPSSSQPSTNSINWTHSRH